MKSEWFDKRLRFNTAVFYNDNENLQITEFVNGVCTIVNSGENTTKGLEIDFIALLGENFILGGADGYRKTDFEGGGGRADGKDTGRISLSYNLPLSRGYLIWMRALIPLTPMQKTFPPALMGIQSLAH